MANIKFVIKKKNKKRRRKMFAEDLVLPPDWFKVKISKSRSVLTFIAKSERNEYR